MKSLEKNTGNIKEELASGCQGSAKEVSKVIVRLPFYETINFVMVNSGQQKKKGK
jgi:hypothetical protein